MEPTANKPHALTPAIALGFEIKHGSVMRDVDMAHPKLNVRDTVARFPDDVESRPGIPLFNLFSPRDVALRENQLRLVQTELDVGPRVPAQYLLYGAGSAATREQSRIGGLPYRPSDVEWPKDSSGRPKEFVCQINFSDSGRLLPDLPGQIMLLFASHEGSEVSPFILEWYPLGLTNLMTVRDLPEFHFTFPMVQGAPVCCWLYETFDYPEAATRIDGTRFAKWKSFAVPCASRIGGVCESCPPGHQHILTLESVRFILDEPYPFVCHGKHLRSAFDRLLWKLAGIFRKATGVRNRCYDILMIGDLGRVHVFKDASGEFVVTDESY